jgi:acetylornithine aminotransferase
VVTVQRGSISKPISGLDHGTTFGGNPIACAAANAVLDVIESKKLMQSAKIFEKKIKKSLSDVSGISEVRGRGLLLGIELTTPIAKKVATLMLEAGVIVNAANDQTIRVAPPLIVTMPQIEKFIEIFKQVMKESDHG